MDANNEEPEQSGNRISMSLTLAQRMCEEYNCELIIAVEISRDIIYTYRPQLKASTSTLLITKFTYFQRMENLEAQRKVISLGRRIVKELKLEDSVDTLSKWVIHYLAEKLVVAESIVGDERVVANKECFDLIVEIWTQRWSLPDGNTFLAKYRPLMDTLEKLTDRNSSTYYTMPGIIFEKPQRHTANY